MDENLLLTSGKHITPAEFFGKYFDLEKYRVLVRGVQWSNTFFWHNSPEKPSLAIVPDPQLPDGIVYALLEPPYGFGEWEHIADKGEWVLELFTGLFGDKERRAALEIWEWSQDCSNVFDAGKEWRGTFFYTVYVPWHQEYFSFIASTTD